MKVGFKRVKLYRYVFVMKPQSSSAIPSLSKDTNIITNNNEKATFINKYFASQKHLNDESVHYQIS